MGSLPTPPINTTDVVTVGGQNQNNDGTATKKKQPMILYITKETIAINTTHGLRERNKAIIKHLGKYRRSLIRGRARKCKKKKKKKKQKPNTRIDNRYINGNRNPLLRL